MKQKLKPFTKFMAICALLVLSSCEKDLYEDHMNSDKHSILVQRKNFEDLKKNTNLMKSIEKFTAKKSNSLQKQYFDSINNFYIDLDNVMFTLDSLNNQTYTFKINRIPSNELFENLILKTSKTGDFDAIIAQYNQNILNLNSTTQLEMVNFINQNVNFIYLGKRTLSEINSKFSFNENCFEPGYVYSSAHTCASGQHSFADGVACDYWGTTDMATSGGYVFTMTGIPCNSGGGSSGGSGGSFSTGPHGGSGSGSGTTKTPCQQLKNNNSKPIANTTPPKTVLDNLNDLNSQMASNPRERMYIMTPTTASENQFIEEFEEGPVNGGEVSYVANLNVISAFMHCHYSTSLLSIFSLADLYQMKYYADSGNIANTSTFTSYLVTAHGTRYAIKFATPNDLNPYNENFFIGWEYDNIRDKREDKYESFVKTSNTPEQNELGFLKFLKNQNLGVEIYKADATFSQWSKLTIGGNGQVKVTPCP